MARPKTGPSIPDGKVLAVRVSADTINQLDDYIAEVSARADGVTLTRTEAARLLIVKTLALRQEQRAA